MQHALHRSDSKYLDRWDWISVGIKWRKRKSKGHLYIFGVTTTCFLWICLTSIHWQRLCACEILRCNTECTRASRNFHRSPFTMALCKTAGTQMASRACESWDFCVSKNFKLLQKLWVLSDVEWRRVTLSDVAWRWVTLMSSDRSDPGVTLNERLYAGIDFPWPRQGLWRDDILGELWGTDDMFSMILIRWLKIKEVWSLKVLLYEVQTCQCSSWTPRALKRSLPRAPHTWTGQRPELGISMESRLWRKTSENTTVIYWYIIYTLIIYIYVIYIDYIL